MRSIKELLQAAYARDLQTARQTDRKGSGYLVARDCQELTIHENEPFIGEWDNSEPVLIYHKDNKYEYPYLIAQYTNGFENNEVGWTEMNDANEVIDVMAWMPLPEPWKGADDE